jgi:hypothetical protein
MLQGKKRKRHEENMRSRVGGRHQKRQGGGRRKTGEQSMLQYLKALYSIIYNM